MRILALDSTALSGSVALYNDRSLVAEYTVNTGNTHSQTLLPMVESVLALAGWSVGDIDLFACTVGPGSFTGVRIGISTVKGLAFGKNKICVGVSTLEAMARGIASFCIDALICPVMDARRGQLYTAVFKPQGGRLIRLMPDSLISAEELSERLDAYDKPVYFTGDGYGIIEAMSLPFMRETPKHARWQSGYGVALAALESYRLAEDKSILTDVLLRPEYLRPSQAERELAGRTI